MLRVVGNTLIFRTNVRFFTNEVEQEEKGRENIDITDHQSQYELPILLEDS